MFREKIRRLRWVWMVLLAIAIPLLGQTPAKPTGPAPTAGGGAKSREFLRLLLSLLRRNQSTFRFCWSHPGWNRNGVCELG